MTGFIDAKVWNNESDIEDVVGAFWMTYDEYYEAVEAVQYHLQGNVVDISYYKYFSLRYFEIIICILRLPLL